MWEKGRSPQGSDDPTCPVLLVCACVSEYIANSLPRTTPTNCLLVLAGETKDMLEHQSDH